jgi:hypothetical protein
MNTAQAADPSSASPLSKQACVSITRLTTPYAFFLYCCASRTDGQSSRATDRSSQLISSTPVSNNASQ